VTELATASEPSTSLSVADIERVIPHRWPFLLLDRIVEYEPEA
jgi:3-hydroxyacyl-[acyl-carrier-protein] dehydratase